MTTVHAEVEAKYDADETFELPDLVELFAGSSREEDAPVGPWTERKPALRRLRATYYDTAGLDLARAGVTLRRRTGGDDAGWHLKVPGDDASRSEVRLPLTAGTTLPRALRSMTYALTEGRTLARIAVIETERTVHRLVDAGGRVLAEVADDRVTARRVDGGHDDEPMSWREVEVEVVDGPPRLLEAVDPVLREHGLSTAREQSKLARVLGLDEDAQADGGRTAAGSEPLDTSSSAGDVVMAYVEAQVVRIRTQDLPVRLDAPGSVHAMRVATRRLRSALRTFKPLLHRARTRPIRDELQWLARVLGAARDAQVLGDRVRSGAATLSAGAGRPVSATIGQGFDEAYRAAQKDVVAALDGDRYRALLDSLTALLDDPPLRRRARRPGRAKLPRLVARSYRELRDAMKSVDQAADDDARRDRRHDARKAAKRTRYAAEAVTAVFPAKARRFARAMEDLQEALGEHLDSLNAQHRMRELAAATASPKVAFAYGWLGGVEQANAARSLAEVERAWKRARKSKLRRWLS